MMDMTVVEEENDRLYANQSGGCSRISVSEKLLNLTLLLRQQCDSKERHLFRRSTNSTLGTEKHQGSYLDTDDLKLLIELL